MLHRVKASLRLLEIQVFGQTIDYINKLAPLAKPEFADRFNALTSCVAHGVRLHIDNPKFADNDSPFLDTCLFNLRVVSGFDAEELLYDLEENHGEFCACHE